MVEPAIPEVMAPQPPNAVPALAQEMSIEQVVARVNKVRELQKRVMKEDIHYGVIPGTPKPTLLKPGAELLLLTFMLDPQYEHTVTQEGKHREILSRCVLYHIPTGSRVASGQGSCSTYESKYAYRRASAVCPKCGHDLMRSKYGSKGWYCNKTRGGCGNNFPLSAVKEGSNRVENPDIADQYNTVLKMSNKRSLIAAVLNATAASEIFTQDAEDFEPDDDSPLSDSQHEAHQEKSTRQDNGPETRAVIVTDGGEAEGMPGAGEGVDPSAPADQDDKAMLAQLVNAHPAPWDKKMKVLKTVKGFTGIENLLKGQLEPCANALKSLTRPTQ